MKRALFNPGAYWAWLEPGKSTRSMLPVIKNGVKLSRLFVAALIGLAFTPPLAAKALPQSSAEQDIMEAVFRHQFQQHSTKRQWKIFYIAIGLSDPAAPPDEFMRRFDRHQPPVKKFVGSEYDSEQMRKEQGLVVGVAEVKIKSETEAEVEGYRFVIPGEAEGFQYVVMLERGKWLVKSSRATWIA